MPDWPHSPAHRLDASGAYIVTAGAYQKQPFFRSAKRLAFLCESLLHIAASHGWKLEAWAVFPNHYHFVATSPRRASTLRQFIGYLHTITAKEINRQDEIFARKVWFQYWESKLTYQKSLFARLNYVHSNAVHHGLVRKPEQYDWCSAGWFLRKAEKSFYQTVMQVRSDRIRVADDFVVEEEGSLLSNRDIPLLESGLSYSIKGNVKRKTLPRPEADAISALASSPQDG